MNILNKLKSLWKRLTDRLTGVDVRQYDAPPKQTKRRQRHEKQHFGSHYYLGDLLDTLEEVFKDLPKIRKADPEGFATYSRLGATVNSSDFRSWNSLDSYFLQNLPSFGCSYAPPRDTEEKVCVRFAMFNKVTRPINVQPVNAPVYCITGTYHMTDKIVYPMQFHVAVMDDEIKLLRELTPKHYTVGKTQMCRMEWTYPRDFDEFVLAKEQTPHDVAKEFFVYAVNSSLARDTGLTVTAQREAMRAVFAIDMLRTPYFFADREKTVTDNGATKKIFHIVRGHYRTVAGGHQQFVKSHFRGLREFEWNGYDIRIGMTGKHGISMSEFNLDSIDPKDVDTANPSHLDAEGVAKRLERVMA